MNRTTPTLRNPWRLGALAVAAAVWVAACGGSGGDDGDAPTAAPALRIGETFTLDTEVDGQLVASREYLLHGITPQGELVATAGADVLPGTLVPLPIEASTKAQAGGRPVADLATLRAFYKRLADARRLPDGRLDVAQLAADIDDLDGDIATLYADQQASGLDEREYLALYGTLNDLPFFAARERAEAELREFLQTVGELERQHAKASDGEQAGSARATTYELGARDWLVALRSAGVDIVAFQAVMAERGQDYLTVKRMAIDWYKANERNTSFKAFVVYYLALPAAKASGDAADAAAPAVCRTGSVDLVKDRQGTTAESCLLWAGDLDRAHYADGQTGATSTVRVRFRQGLLSVTTVELPVSVSWGAQYTGAGKAQADQVSAFWIPSVKATLHIKDMRESVTPQASMSVERLERQDPQLGTVAGLRVMTYVELWGAATTRLVNTPETLHGFDLDAQRGITFQW